MSSVICFTLSYLDKHAALEINTNALFPVISKGHVNHFSQTRTKSSFSAKTMRWSWKQGFCRAPEQVKCRTVTKARKLCPSSPPPQHIIYWCRSCCSSRHCVGDSTLEIASQCVGRFLSALLLHVFPLKMLKWVFNLNLEHTGDVHVQSAVRSFCQSFLVAPLCVTQDAGFHML